MISLELKKEYYSALVARNSDYDGTFYVGIKTTGVFCRSVCPARKPKFENCEFFEKAEEALLAGFRPCKRCHPLSQPDQAPEVVRRLIEAVEQHPEKRWKEKDFRMLSTNAVQASRVFKKRFGMTFVAYARARRMGIALKQIKEKGPVIDAQLETGYESGSGFRDAFSKIMGFPPARSEEVNLFKADWIDTPLGPMVAIGGEEALYLLEFVGRRGLEKEVERLRKKMKVTIVPGQSPPLQSIKKELGLYFKGCLENFHTPIKLIGSPFQMKVWLELQNIPIGETRSYADMAKALGVEGAARAIGRANGSNQLAIIIPCHRVIGASGELTGYAGGLARKRWLLAHEGKTSQKSF
ncbi:methylated-DNA--[protein]-cysteine S-methyltransferase [Candidatus Neptunochlamydia vexilliferae]|uniref:Methylated-DNA--protein-cysteine methyltransferase n=1 Tax=Candidatus Neptunichlamydia vexilliferae TaxID=1651774 RepID=A0ABS0AXD6_9BACT|nr:trifunctional transcriptional activator/DNA repair protein Ada/methylated-DNA--[protein]-cysteine S-methyltransferase [Candidatus Neptunochlamydia vexilliferae]MBF5058804.1 Bifunctional transcriptional activator/DNA repair enzyme Ada [Candidatus Neptunochlamydia vexilliferae]